MHYARFFFFWAFFATYCVVIAAEKQQEKHSVLFDFSEESSLDWQDVSYKQVGQLLSSIGISKVLLHEANCFRESLPVLLDAHVLEVEFSVMHPGRESLIRIEVHSCDQPDWNKQSYFFLQTRDKKILSHLEESCSLGEKLIQAHPQSREQYLLTSCGDTGQGITETYSKIIGYQEKKLKVIEDLGLVRFNNCGAGESGEEFVSVIFVDSQLKRSIKNYKKSCSETTSEKHKFRYDSSGPLEQRTLVRPPK